MPILWLIEISCQLNDFFLAERLNLHIDKILFDLFGNIIDDDDHVAVSQSLLVKIQFQFRVEPVGFGLRVNSKSLDLVNNSEIRG